MKLVTEVLKASRAQLMPEEWCATATKKGQHKEALDKITGQRLHPLVVGKACEEEMTSMCRLKVFEHASE